MEEIERLKNLFEEEKNSWQDLLRRREKELREALTEKENLAVEQRKRFEKEINDRLARFEEERRTWQERLFAIEKENARLESELEAKTKEYQEQKDEAGRKLAEYERINLAQIGTLQAEIKRKDDQLIEKSAEYVEKLGQIQNAWESRVAGIEAELKQNRQAFSQFQQEHQQEIDDLEAEHQRETKRREEQSRFNLETQVTELKRQNYAEIQAANTRFENQLKAEKEKILAETSALVKNYETQLNKLEVLLEELGRQGDAEAEEMQKRYHNEIDALKKIADEKEGEIDKLNKIVTEPLSLLKQREEEIHRLEDEVRRLSAALEGERRESARQLALEREAIGRNFEQRLSAKETESAALLAEKEQAMQAIENRLSSELKSLQNKWESERDGWLETLKAKDKDFQVSREQIVEQLAKTRQALEKKEQECKTLQDKFTAERKAIEEKIDAERQEFYGKIKDSEKENDDLKIRLALTGSQLKAEISRRETEITQVKVLYESKLKALETRMLTEKTEMERRLKEMKSANSEADVQSAVREIFSQTDSNPSPNG